MSEPRARPRRLTRVAPSAPKAGGLRDVRSIEEFCELRELAGGHDEPGYFRELDCELDDARAEADAATIATLQRELQKRDEILATEKEARARVEAAQNARERFVAVLCHDLRGPIHTVLGWTQLMRRHAFGADAQARAISTIERAAQSQLSLVEELLDVSRIAASKMHLAPAPLDLSSLAARVIEAMTPAANTAGIDLAIDRPQRSVIVLGDKKRLEQVLTNLVTNALKFTRSAGRIDVSVRQEGASAVVSVRDTGRGIPSDALVSIFEAFRQHDEDPTRMGLGLGLYIVRNLVELHGGTVQVESAGVGRGATFTVRLPCRELVAAPISNPSLDAVDPDELEGVRVLVVDPDQDGLDLLGAALERSGAEVLFARSAKVARTIFAAEGPDVIIVDMRLGDDARHLIRAVRTISPRVVAIAQSALPRRDAKRGLTAAFDAHLVKPVDLGKLVDTVRDTLDQRAARRPASA